MQLQLTIFKTCKDCEIEKVIQDFPPRKGAPSGVRNACRQCFSANRSEYREANRERIAEKKRRYREDNREYIKKYLRDYYQSNLELARQKKAKYRKLHLEEAAARSRKWYEKNRELAIERARQWRKDNPESVRASASIRRVRERAQAGEPYGGEDIARMHEDQGGLCFYCQEPLSEYHIEHKIPIARGGLACLYNICLSCPDCNMRKGTKTPEEFRQ